MIPFPRHYVVADSGAIKLLAHEVLNQWRLNPSVQKAFAASVLAIGRTLFHVIIVSALCYTHDCVMSILKTIFEYSFLKTQL